MHATTSAAPRPQCLASAHPSVYVLPPTLGADDRLTEIGGATPRSGRRATFLVAPALVSRGRQPRRNHEAVAAAQTTRVPGALHLKERLNLVGVLTRRTGWRPASSRRDPGSFGFINHSICFAAQSISLADDEQRAYQPERGRQTRVAAASRSRGESAAQEELNHVRQWLSFGITATH